MSYKKMMSKENWEEYKRVQESGVMNMFEHPLMLILCGSAFHASENYARCQKHFDEEGNEHPLEMI